MTNDNVETGLIYSSLVESDPDLAELVALFIEEMPARQVRIQGFWDTKNMPELLRSVHQLKGAGGSYGFAPLTAIAAVAESQIKNGLAEEEIQETIESLKDLCSRITSEARP